MTATMHQPSRKRPASTTRMLKAIAFLAPAAVMILIFVFYPVIRTVQLGFQNFNLFDQLNVGYNGLENFRNIVEDPNFSRIMKNTFLWVFVSVFFQFTIGFSLALLMKAKFKFIGIYQGLIFIPWALSGFLMGLVWKWIFDESFGVLNDALLKLGLIDSRIPWLSDARWAMAAVIIANIWYGVTFFVIMILAALQGVPKEMLEAAELDGANRFQTLFSVIIPYIRATLILIVLLRVMWITNFPDLIFGMTSGGPAGQTHIISSWLIEKLTLDANWGQASALGLMTMVILFVFTLFYLMATRLEKDSGV
jgi:multiple sugar transport system permease protein